MLGHEFGETCSEEAPEDGADDEEGDEEEFGDSC